MKTFKVTGWYRSFNSEKDFISEDFKCENLKIAIQLFSEKYKNINFYKIEI